MNHDTDSARQSGSASRADFMSGLNDAIRENPVPAALVGMGLLWLFAGGRNVRLGGATSSMAGGMGRAAHGAGAAAYRGVRSAAGRVGDGARAAAQGAEAAASKVAETATDIAGTMRNAFPTDSQQSGESDDQIVPWDSYQDEGGWAARREGLGSQMSSVQDTLADLFARQPLMLGAVGVAIGAAVAASLPASSVENRLMGETSEALKDRAEELWDEAKSRGSDVASVAIAEAESQGLTPKAVGDVAKEVGARAASLAGAVATDITETIRR